MKSRPQAADPLWNSEAAPAQWAISAALEPLDKIAIETEARWGFGALERLVSPETAARFASARKKLDDVMHGLDWQEVAKRASVLIRGWQALEKEATAAGHVPGEISRFWAISADKGEKFVFVQHEADMGAAVKKYPGHQAWAMSEVVRVLAEHSLVAVTAAKVKDVFPGATVTEIRKPNVLQKMGINDEIPF